MKIVSVDSKTLKVMLTQKESELLTLDYNQFDYNKETTQKALDIILYKISVNLKMNLPKETTKINVYPYIDCGILINVTTKDDMKL